VSPGTSARLFVALDLPPEARSALLVPSSDALRPVAVDALHITLAFLGHLPEKSIPAVQAAAFANLDGLVAPALSVSAWKGVPPRRPRLFAADLADEDGRCAAVAEAVQSGLIASSLYEAEKRPFWPHVTCARVRAHEKPPRVESLGPPPALSFVAADVVL
jgi:2'-5' RNA ligase